MEQETQTLPDSHSQIMLALGTMQGELKRGIEGVNKRLDTLNGTVAKHELRLNAQDVMNAQTTITQQQLVTKLQTDVTDKKDMKKFWVGLLVPLLVSACTFLFILILTKTGILNLQ